jgi:hypothetical protein
MRNSATVHLSSFAQAFASPALLAEMVRASVRIVMLAESFVHAEDGTHGTQAA